MRDVIRAQRRRRRLRFWLVFLAIAGVGSAWAGLTKDSLAPGFLDVQAEPAIVERPAIAEVEMVEVEMVEAGEDSEPPTTIPLTPPSTVAPSTVAPSTVAP